MRPRRGDSAIRSGQRRTRGQALVEFALVIPLFLILLMAIVDVGRGIYMYNGVSEAAREIARSASVHPGTPLGSSSQTTRVIDIQRGLIPGLQLGGSADDTSDSHEVGFDCVDMTGAEVPGGTCFPGSRVKVTVKTEFEPFFGMLKWLGTFSLESSSSIEISNL